MKNSDRLLIGIAILVVLVMCAEIRRFNLWAQTQQPNGSLARPYDCTKKRLSPFVRDSNGKFWAIDVCAVADSAEGEDFRTKVGL